ncbi:hypothetical protein HaLaN_19523 [Haematococcus lacustris]|uniref:Uncharacterized protein n=1 Tax=Haematococcus lacustris TaxID=44745 RepID=A0A699ZLY6_HAELA|nr:hypothetical protein HaLaN_19523 [Haematococcus lacustris]
MPSTAGRQPGETVNRHRRHTQRLVHLYRRRSSDSELRARLNSVVGVGRCSLQADLAVGCPTVSCLSGLATARRTAHRVMAKKKHKKDPGKKQKGA